MNLLSVVFLVTGLAMAQTVNLKGKPELRHCAESFLKTFLPQVASGHIEGRLDHYDQLAMILKLSKANPMYAHVALPQIAEALEHTENPLIAALDQRLAKVKQEPSSLAVCLLSGSCRMTERQAIYIPGSNRLFELADLKAYKIGGKGWADMTGTSLTRRRPPIVVLGQAAQFLGNFGNNPAADAKYWGSLLLAQLSIFSDDLLLADWITANQTLRRHHEKTDALFDRYVVEHEGMTILDEGFFRIFIESRATNMRHMFLQNNFDAATDPDLTLMARFEAVREVAPYRDRAPHVLAHHQLTMENIFEFGIDVGRTLADTIQRAAPFNQGS